MLKVGGWLKGHNPVHTTKSLNALDEIAQTVTHIMADDVETAEANLSKGTSPFHQLGVGVCTFMRATLGFEQEIMREAANTLYQAENSAYEQQRRAGKDPNAYRSPIYPPGTEYAVCQAEAQLMSAIVGVLNESLTEAIKSFYKLRKAYLALEAVLENEKKFLKERSVSSVNSVGSKASSKAESVRLNKAGSTIGDSNPGVSAAASTTSLNRSQEAGASAASKESSRGTRQISGNNSDDDEFDFVDAEQDRTGNETPLEYTGHLNVATGQGGSIAVDTRQRKLDIESSTAPNLPPTYEKPSAAVPQAIEDFEQLTLNDLGGPEADLATFSDHPVDQFILSGSNFCFGMLLLLLSFIPPSFASLLKIVGFKGDRDRGMAMLWQATKFHNIHGAMAGVVLMGYLNGFTNFCDILPSSGEGSYPKERCVALLKYMRGRYPRSHLYLLEEARMLAVEKDLERSIKFVEDAGESQLKQLEALGWFERSLNNMYIHDYEKTAIAFQKCITLNNWSHGLYYFICGASYVEIYRRNKISDPEVAKTAAVRAETFLQLVVPNTGKKKFMARQLPFDVFVIRKIQKWEARAKEWKCDFVDAIGVSPLEEMIYFWNGYKRMRVDHLEVSLQNLAWSESAANPFWEKENLDERAILTVLRAATLRNMGRTAEAKALLEKEILPVDRTLLKGNLKDNWMAPCARYEMAANLWREADADGHPEAHMKTLDQCRDWLDEVTKWEAYDLDARIGMKITTGKETLRKFSQPHCDIHTPLSRRAPAQVVDMTTDSTGNYTVFCPRDGSKWYACTSGSQFVGCCKLSPCERGCEDGYISPALMPADAFGMLPDPTCGMEANSYTCSIRGLAFFGCCASNACASGGCPPSDVRPAFMDRDVQFHTYLNITQPLLPTISTGVVADGPPKLLPIQSGSPDNRHSIALVIIGLCIALLLALPIALGIWIGNRHRLGSSRNRPASPEWISLPTYPENAKVTDVHVRPTGPHIVSKDISRLGYRTLLVLSVTGLVTLGVSGFLTFLWFGDSDNKTWHRIMLNNWATRAVSVSALLLRTSVDFQAAVATSIIVALLLESRTGVHIPHLAGLSPARTGSAGPATLFSFVIRDVWRAAKKRARNQGWGMISGCLLLTTGILQFSSTLLLSDLKPGVLGGQGAKSQVRNGLSYRNVTQRITRDSAWTSNPPFYPSFGEYSQLLEDSEVGIDDTGVLLRTFLPYATAESRQTLRTYLGKALVLDARVSCQAPAIKWGNNTGHHRMLTGEANITRNASLLQKMTPSTFSCAIAGPNEYTLCQIGKSYPWFMGSLTSQFENSTSFGTAFLVIKGTDKKTSLSDSDKSRPNWYRDPGEEWLNVDFANSTGRGASLSLCFAPWDASVLDVQLTSTSNRTEPLIRWWGNFKTSDILNHLLPQRRATRQILEMARPHSFRGDLPPKEERPLVQSDASGSSAAGYGSNTPLPENWSIFLNGQPFITTLNSFQKAPTQSIAADPALAAIFTDAMRSTGSVAWALSSLITVLSMSNYYSQQPAFDRLDDVTVSFFTTVFFPQKTLGLMVLMWTLVAHLLLVVALIVLFIKRTRLTLLGNAWSAFLQMANSRELMGSLSDMEQKNDNAIQDEMKELGMTERRARIERKGERVEVVLI
ncbi:hypothetical protein T440DRAFT_384667 [Plenodomus tracheiphilus IPT5]|uniref:Inclusion body clearance protein IML2 n=1 Tax=Plenodomus tracheiphilus IPT5 TaxID=1408161 RepID=A0A6A7BMY9_9PLEO|nr:hypothetical protein T440DRAFT_384667 [Plenodomus tracheiphilus IPT5]